jgi:hypothetical protein
MMGELDQAMKFYKEFIEEYNYSVYRVVEDFHEVELVDLEKLGNSFDMDVVLVPNF